jgi:hypothetical protein
LRKIESLLGYDRNYLFSIAEKAGNYYKPFDMLAPGKTKWRHIDNPVQELKNIQSRIKSKILETVSLPDTMIGGIKGKSPAINASYHTKQHVVVTLDLKSCFPKLNNPKIFSVYRNVFGCNNDIAHLLTKMTTFQHRLPQGAPTSTLLANMALLPMHNELKALFENNGIRWTFYIDDIAFSGEKAVNVMDKAIKTIQKHGHAISNKKKKIMNKSGRQEITGLCVNDKVSVNSKKIEELRRDIIDLSYEIDIDNNKLQSLKGSINYVKQTCPLRGESLEKLYKKLLPEKTEIKGVKVKNLTKPCNCTDKHKEFRNHK